MEKHQSFDYCPDHPQVFLVGLMSCLVQYRYGRFIPLYVVGFHDFLPEYLVKWLEKFNRRLEPSVYGTFTGLEAQVMQLFHLAVEGKMILIFLQEYLRQTEGKERRNVLQLLNDMVSDGNAGLCEEVFASSVSGRRLDSDGLRACYYILSKKDSRPSALDLLSDPPVLNYTPDLSSYDSLLAGGAEYV